jgi:hypothetical protein
VLRKQRISQSLILIIFGRNNATPGGKAWDNVSLVWVASGRVLMDTCARGYHEAGTEARKKQKKVMNYDLAKPCQDGRKPEDKTVYLFVAGVAVGMHKKSCQAPRTPAKESMIFNDDFSGNGTLNASARKENYQ